MVWTHHRSDHHPVSPSIDAREFCWKPELALLTILSHPFMVAFPAAISSASEQNVWSERLAQHLGVAIKIYCQYPSDTTFLFETSLILATVTLFLASKFGKVDSTNHFSSFKLQKDLYGLRLGHSYSACALLLIQEWTHQLSFAIGPDLVRLIHRYESRNFVGSNLWRVDWCWKS